MDIHQYFYFAGVTLILPVWIILFLKKECRKDMIFVGIIGGITATIVEHLYAELDYWTPIFLIPQIPFEDFYYGFIFGGIGAELYERIFKIKNVRRAKNFNYKAMIVLFGILAAFSFILLVNVLHLNSIVAHIVPTIIVGIVTIVLRKDLLKPALFSGFALTILTGIMFIILHLWYPDIFINHWMLKNLSGIYFIGIPLEEYLFAFSVGFAASNIYELLFGYTLVKEK